jgi:hypothetical protein
MNHLNSTHQFNIAFAKLKATHSTLVRSTKVVSRRQGKHACLVILSEKQYADHRIEDQPVQCELHPDDLKDGALSQIVTIESLTSSWARKNNVLSGETTLFAENAIIDDLSNELIIPSSATIMVCHLINVLLSFAFLKEFMSLTNSFIPDCS